MPVPAMSPFEWGSTITSIVGFAVVVISLRELTQQTRSQTDALRSAAYAAVTAQTLEIDRIFLEYPRLRRYFYDDTQIENDDADYIRVITIADALLDFYESLLVQLPFNPTMRAGWENYMVDAFARSTVLREYFETVKDWYAHELSELKERADSKRVGTGRS